MYVFEKEMMPKFVPQYNLALLAVHSSILTNSEITDFIIILPSSFTSPVTKGREINLKVQDLTSYMQGHLKNIPSLDLMYYWS